LCLSHFVTPGFAVGQIPLFNFWNEPTCCIAAFQAFFAAPQQFYSSS
jgi:hypothetical protein